jgi:hypothetical protein
MQFHHHLTTTTLASFLIATAAALPAAPVLSGPFEIRQDQGDGVFCQGFTTDSRKDLFTDQVRVSDDVDCIQASEDNGCKITAEKQYTESFTTSYSFSAGGTIKGGLDLGASFGQSVSNAYPLRLS